MKNAQFENLIDAAIYRKNHGGWLFVNECCEAWWFDAYHYTPSTIMLHRSVRGMSGELVCDNRFVDAYKKTQSAIAN